MFKFNSIANFLYTLATFCQPKIIIAKVILTFHLHTCMMCSCMLNYVCECGYTCVIGACAEVRDNFRCSTFTFILFQTGLFQSLWHNSSQFQGLRFIPYLLQQIPGSKPQASRDTPVSTSQLPTGAVRLHTHMPAVMWTQALKCTASTLSNELLPQPKTKFPLRFSLGKPALILGMHCCPSCTCHPPSLNASD